MKNWTALVTLLSVFSYFYMAFRVGRARAAFRIAPPATTGDPGFERVFRAHQNMLEWMPIYLPSLWLFAFYVSDPLAAILGLAWMGARLHYALSYAASVEKRFFGFVTQGAICALLSLGALIGVVKQLLL